MAADPVPATLPTVGVHQGRGDCLGLLRQTLLALAPGSGDGDGATTLTATREVWLVDAQFEHWPLDEPEVLAALTAWLRQGGRRLQLIGLDFESSARALPRFTRWRRDWGHALAVHRPADGQLPAAMRGLLATPFWLQWLDADTSRLRVNNGADATIAAQSQLADFLQRCEPDWPLTTLGL